MCVCVCVRAGGWVGVTVVLIWIMLRLRLGILVSCSAGVGGAPRVSWPPNPVSRDARVRNCSGRREGYYDAWYGFDSVTIMMIRRGKRRRIRVGVSFHAKASQVSKTVTKKVHKQMLNLL